MGIPAYVHLRRAKDLADARHAEPLDVPALARAALSSEAHFIRSFKRAYGETPHGTSRGGGSSAPPSCCARRTGR